MKIRKAQSVFMSPLKLAENFIVTKKMFFMLKREKEKYNREISSKLKTVDFNC